MLRARRKVLQVLKPLALAFALFTFGLTVFTERKTPDFGTADVEKENNLDGFCQFHLPPPSPWYEWKRIRNSQQMHLFSAFLERKVDKYSILVLGITSGLERNYFCRVWSDDLRIQIVLESVVEQMLDIHNKKLEFEFDSLYLNQVKLIHS